MFILITKTYFNFNKKLKKDFKWHFFQNNKLLILLTIKSNVLKGKLKHE